MISMSLNFNIRTSWNSWNLKNNKLNPIILKPEMCQSQSCRATRYIQNRRSLRRSRNSRREIENECARHQRRRHRYRPSIWAWSKIGHRSCRMAQSRHNMASSQQELELQLPLFQLRTQFFWRVVLKYKFRSHKAEKASPHAILSAAFQKLPKTNSKAPKSSKLVLSKAQMPSSPSTAPKTKSQSSITISSSVRSPFISKLAQTATAATVSS